MIKLIDMISLILQRKALDSTEVTPLRHYFKLALAKSKTLLSRKQKH